MFVLVQAFQLHLKGSKTRSRTCAPAKNGGSPCPNKKKEKDLFYEDMDCTQKDCESKLI